jgi:hypothetical protein
VAINQVREEKELTIQVKGEKEREVEHNHRTISKLSKIIDRVFKNAKAA